MGNRSRRRDGRSVGIEHRLRDFVLQGRDLSFGHLCRAGWILGVLDLQVSGGLAECICAAFCGGCVIESVLVAFWAQS